MERLAAPADPSGAYERIVEKKVRRRIMRRLQIVALAFVVLAGTVGGTFALARAFRTNPQHVPLAIVNPGNGKIAFVSERDGNEEIYAINQDGTGLQRLTRDPAVDAFPVWSPDGSKIAFVRATEARQDVYVMNADGSHQRDLTPTAGAREGDPAWSPDGRMIAFASDQSGTYEIWVMDTDGRQPQRLTDVAAPGVNHPAWSPNGTMIAFSAFQRSGRGGGIYVMNADGSEVREILQEKQENVVDLLRAGAWSPDGATILFTREVRGNRPGASDLYSVRVDGTGLRRVVDRTSASHLGSLSGGAWSPNGKEIVFEGLSDIYVMKAGGQDPQKVVDEGASFGVSWQPVPPAESPTLVSPTPAMSSTPSASPEPSATPSPGPPAPACATSFVYGDFDGNGQSDTAAICPVEGGTFSLNVQWSGGASGAVAMPDCDTVCVARGAGDVNGDGSDEFFLEYAQGASTDFIEVYELPASEAFGHSPIRTAKPGSPPGFPPDEPTRFDIGGSVTHQGYLTCQAGDSTPELISTGTQLSDDQTTWNLHETVFTLDGSGLAAQFVVVSSRDYTAPNDPNQPFVPPGDPCLDL